MADHSKNLCFVQTTAGLLALLRHRVAVVAKWLVSAAFAIRVAICRKTGSNVLLASCIHEVQHVFDVGEGLHGVAFIQNLSCTTGTIGTVAPCTT